MMVYRWSDIKPMRHCLELDGDASLGVRPCRNEVGIQNDDGAVSMAQRVNPNQDYTRVRETVLLSDTQRRGLTQ
jgi:hypothetical protein